MATMPPTPEPDQTALKEAQEAADEAAEKARVAQHLAEEAAERAKRTREEAEELQVERIMQPPEESVEPQSVALAQQREVEATLEAMSSDCFKENAVYLPIDMDNSERSLEVSAKKCQERCSRTNGCAHFSYWPSDGGCHLQDSDAVLQENAESGVVAGPASCKAEAYCHKYIEDMGCWWTISHSCAGQVRGKIGFARDDGSRGYQCCCVYEMWKQDKEAAKRALPGEAQEEKEAPMLCTASHGATLGGPVCCGQDGFVSKLSHVCPQDRPTCVGLVSHLEWGTCQVAEPWQQCGGMKDGEEWWGPTTCTEGYECKAWSRDYSQCARVQEVVMMNSMFKMPRLLHSRWQSAAVMACAGSVAIAAVLMFARKALRSVYSLTAVSGADQRDLGMAPESVAAGLPSRPSTTSLLGAESFTV